MGLRRLAPIRVESLPRAVVRAQRIAGAHTVGRVCVCGDRRFAREACYGCRLGMDVARRGCTEGGVGCFASGTCGRVRDVWRSNGRQR